jgi:hypothetical protein
MDTEFLFEMMKNFQRWVVVVVVVTKQRESI